MKKILILSIAVIFILELTSCSQEVIETYKDTENIYFSNSVFPPNGLGAQLIDSTGYSFGFDKETVTEKIFKIPIRVQGKISNVDRKVKITIDPSSTAVAGTHFIMSENIFMHAGMAVDTFVVKALRTPDMKTNTLTLVMNLEDNEFFTTKMQNKITNVLTQKTMSHIRFKLSFEDKLSQPKAWYVPSLGVFTPKKFFLMCDVMNLDPSIFLGTLSVAEIQYYGSFMRRYLADQKASGNTIYDDNGAEMVFS